MTNAAIPSPISSAHSTTGTIVAHKRYISTDTRCTGINNNMLVIGPSGVGKTRHVLKPNLLQMNSSYLVLDTKGTLCREMAPVLIEHGYRVERINFADLASHTQTKGTATPGCGLSWQHSVHEVGYNPLAFIRRGSDGRPNQQDITSVAKALCPHEDQKEPFWDNAAANLLACLIAYTVEQLPKCEQNLSSTIKLLEHLGDEATIALLEDLEAFDPESYALTLWRRYSSTRTAEKMNASIIGILAEKMFALGFEGARALYEHEEQVDFASLGREKHALFVTIDDLDRSLDPLTNLFVSQAIRELAREADRNPAGRLVQPVRLMLDDFANLNIPDIDNVLSVVRSREIWVTLLLQSINQLEAIYGRPRAMSILGNCDTQLVLAFQDFESAEAYAQRAGKLPASLFATPHEHVWLFVRGCQAEEVAAYKLTEHPAYQELPEAHELKVHPLSWDSNEPKFEELELDSSDLTRVA